MYLTLSKRGAEHRPNDLIFPTRELIPALNQQHGPALLFVIPVHHVRRVYGYAVLTDTPQHIFRINTVLVSWLNAFANGLRTLQKRLYTEYLREKVERASMYDLMPGLYSKRAFCGSFRSVRSKTADICCCL